MWAEQHCQSEPVLYRWVAFKQKVKCLLGVNTQYFSSVTQSCPTLHDPMDCSMPGFLVHHQLPELAQTHVHRVSDAIQPSHPLLSPSLPKEKIVSFNLSQHQDFFLMTRFFPSGNQSTRASASVLPMNIQGWFPSGLTGWISFCPRDSQESSPTPEFKSIKFFGTQLSF